MQKYLGQFFTKLEMAEKLVNIFKNNFPIVDYNNMNILEPSCGSGNFIQAILNKEPQNTTITGYEIDSSIPSKRQGHFNFIDFFEVNPIYDNQYDLIIGNPPFSKKKDIETFYTYKKSHAFNPFFYEHGNISLEKAFIYKSTFHLREDGLNTIAFILPLSFWATNRNKAIKNLLHEKFSNILIYQDDENWFEGEQKIGCCFSIFTNEKYRGSENSKIIRIYDDFVKIVQKDHETIMDNMIPKNEYYYSKENSGNRELREFVIPRKRTRPKNPQITGKNVYDYASVTDSNSDCWMVIGRVGDGTIGRTGLVPINSTIGESFYVFEFVDGLSIDTKNEICKQVNEKRPFLLKIGRKVGQCTVTREELLKLKLTI